MSARGTEPMDIVPLARQQKPVVYFPKEHECTPTFCLLGGRHEVNLKQDDITKVLVLGRRQP